MMKFMKQRHKDITKNTFTLLYDKDDDFLEVYIIENVLIGSICRDVKEKPKMIGDKLKRVKEVELTVEIQDRFEGKVRDLCFAILTCVASLIEDGDIKGDRDSAHRMQSLSCFFDFTKEMADKVTKESY